MAGKNSSFVCTHIRGYPFISFKREPLLMYPQCIPFLSVALPSTVLLLITSLHLKLVLLPSTNSYPYPNYDNLKRWPFLRNKFLFNPTIIYLNYQADRVRALISGLLDPRGSSDRLAWLMSCLQFLFLFVSNDDILRFCSSLAGFVGDRVRNDCFLKTSGCSYYNPKFI